MTIEKYLSLDYQSLPNVNIGDYIQVAASLNFLESEPSDLIERDNMSVYGGGGYLIANCWYAHNNETFPVHTKADIKFISFHLNTKIGELLLSDNVNVKFLKNLGPVGCRDYQTVEELSKAGIEAYFSSCLTTTLGLMEATEELDKERSRICVTDVVSTLPDRSFVEKITEFSQLFLFSIFKIPLVLDILYKLKKNQPIEMKLSAKRYVSRLLYAVRTAFVVNQLFDRADLHLCDYYQHNFTAQDLPTRLLRLSYAKFLLHRYATAKLVVSSRIHCCLPSLSYYTPNLYLQQTNDPLESRCRKSGLLNLLNVVEVNGLKILNAHNFKSQIVKLDVQVRTEFISYARKMIETLKSRKH